MARPALKRRGHQFGWLTVVAQAKSRRFPGGKTQTYWLCRCRCGKANMVSSSSLVSGHVKSCGCRRRKHGAVAGGKKTPEYTSWYAAKKRCFYLKHRDYHRYGGRGITMCKRWIHSFSAFLSDMGKRKRGLTLDRIDNDGNYTPLNCRWATPKQQRANRALA
jgi:hypothetical protein